MFSSASEKEEVKCSKSTSSTESSRGTNQTSTSRKPKALATGTNPFSCSEKRLFQPPAHWGGEEGRHKGENVETPLIRSKHLLSLIISKSRHRRPNLNKKKTKLHPAMLISPTALPQRYWTRYRKKRTGNQLPATMISLACVGLSQL